jgi:hypothetical protein
MNSYNEAAYQHPHLSFHLCFTLATIPAERHSPHPPNRPDDVTAGTSQDEHKDEAEALVSRW